MAEQKTNVMRILEQKKVKYTSTQYPHGDEAVDGRTVAAITGVDPAGVFKTLVSKGASGRIYVFVIPVSLELDPKSAAKAVREKSIAMVHVNEINELTGYIRGGCSPIGMKKQYTTVYHESIADLDNVHVSAGKIGFQVGLHPQNLIKITNGQIANIATEG